MRRLVARSAGFFSFFLAFFLQLEAQVSQVWFFFLLSQNNKTIRRPFFEYHLLLVIGGQQVGHDLLRVGQGRLDERFVTVIAIGIDRFFSEGGGVKKEGCKF